MIKIQSNGVCEPVTQVIKHYLSVRHLKETGCYKNTQSFRPGFAFSYPHSLTLWLLSKLLDSVHQFFHMNKDCIHIVSINLNNILGIGSIIKYIVKVKLHNHSLTQFVLFVYMSIWSPGLKNYSVLSCTFQSPLNKPLQYRRISAKSWFAKYCAFQLIFQDLDRKLIGSGIGFPCHT